MPHGIRAIATMLPVLLAVGSVATPAPARAARPEVDRLRAIVARHPRRDIAGIERDVAAAPVPHRVRDFCVVAPNDGVACIDVEKLLREELAGPADQNIMRMALDDALDVMGAPVGADTLLACSSAHGTDFTDVFAISNGPPVGAGAPGAAPGAPRGATPALGGGGTTMAPDADIMGAATGATRSGMLGRCRGAQQARLAGTLGQPGLRDPSYAGAVSSAVAAMDAAAAGCHDSGTGAIASDTTGASNSAPNTPKDGGATATPGAKPGSDTTAGQNAAGQNAGEQGKGGKEKPKDADTVITTSAVAMGVAEVIINGAKIAADPGSALAKTVVATVATVAGGGSVVKKSETAENVGRLFDVTQAVIEATSEEAVEGVAALGFEAALPAAVAGFAGYGGTRLLNSAMDGAIDRAAVNAVGAVSDFAFDHFAPTSGKGASRPDPTGEGKPSCSQLAAAWHRFEHYCAQPGNDWHTYDCQVFVAKMNGCADPAIIYPSPEGDYTCSSHCRGGVTARGRAGGQCTEAAIAACEQHQKLRSMLSMPGRGGSNDGSGAPSCRQYITSLASYSDMLKANAKVNLCKRANGEFCDQAISISGPSQGPRPGATPVTPARGTPGLPTPQLSGTGAGTPPPGGTGSSPPAPTSGTPAPTPKR